MANWSPLRERLRSVDRLTISWQDLDDLVGGLPRSALDHPAFWKGERSGWPGFRTTDVSVGRSVTFVRHQSEPAHGPSMRSRLGNPQPARDATHPDVVLVGCVKRKLPQAAPARDLYDSALFRKARAYAESSGARWFVLSAEHGLVEPSTVLEPYDVRLSKMPRNYRRAWGKRLVDDQVRECGDLGGRVVEIHAGAAYADAIRDHLLAEGASVIEPLQGLAGVPPCVVHLGSRAATSRRCLGTRRR